MSKLANIIGITSLILLVVAVATLMAVSDTAPKVEYAVSAVCTVDNDVKVHENLRDAYLKGGATYIIDNRGALLVYPNLCYIVKVPKV